MAVPKADEVISEVLACASFNSQQGRDVQERARKLLLAGLPASIDAARAELLYARYLDEAPYSLWRVLHKTRRAHAGALLAALSRHPSLVSDFVVGAVLGGKTTVTIDDERFEQLIRAGVALAKIESFSRSAGSRDHSLRVAFIAEDARLVDGIRRALDPRVADDETHDNFGAWLWFMSVLAQDASPPTLRLLSRFGEVAKERDDVGVLARLWGYHAPASPGLARLVDGLLASQSAKIARSGGAAIGRMIGLPAEGWWLEILANADDGKPDCYRFPIALLKAHAGEPPETWSVRVQPEGEYSYFEEGGSAVNGLGLPTPPEDPLALRAWFDAAGEKIGVRWRWAQAGVKTNLKGVDRQRLAAWARGA